MSGSIKTRSRTKGNKTTRGDASAAPDNPGNSRIREERGHKAHALSNNTTTTQMLVSSSTHRSIERGQNETGSASSERPGNGRTTSTEARTMQTTASSTFDDYGAGNGPNTSGSSSHRSIERGQNQSGSASSERPGSRCTTSNEARTMQRTASSTFDDYGAGNGPNTSGMSSNVPTTSNDARMVQTIAPSSLLSDNNAVPTGSGTATFQNVKTTRTFLSSSSIAYDEPGRPEDGPMPSFYPSSPTGTQPQGMGGVLNLPLHETQQGLKGKGWAMLSWPSSLYDLRMDIGDATMASQELNRLSQTTARSKKMGGAVQNKQGWTTSPQRL